MHTQGLYATEYHYLNVVPNSRVESAHREILSLAIDLDCMIIKQLNEISVHRSIIDAMIYAMYIHERILSAGTVGLEVILNMAFILFSPMP